MTAIIAVLAIAAVAAVASWLGQHRAWTRYDRGRPDGWGE